MLWTEDTAETEVSRLTLSTCVAWRQQAEFICRYFNKGKLIGLEGQIQTRSWDGQDGKRQYATEVLVDNVEFIGSKSESGSNTQGAYQSNFGGYQSAPAPNPMPAASAACR